MFGYDARPNLIEIAETLGNDAWSPLRRRHPGTPKTERRGKRFRTREEIVVANEYENKKLEEESIAEFDYQPSKCSRKYRMIVLRKKIAVRKGERRLFDEYVYHFYVTNESRSTCSSRQVVFHANDRCNQENTISQLHSSGALAAPLDNLTSNWAYMVIGSLAWSLKCWSGLIIRPEGNLKQQQVQQTLKTKIVRMEFQTFVQAIIQVPAQIIRTSRRLIFRLLSYRESVESLLTLHEHACYPLRC